MAATSAQEILGISLLADTSDVESGFASAEVVADRITKKIGDGFREMWKTAKSNVTSMNERIAELRKAAREELSSSANWGEAALARIKVALYSIPDILQTTAERSAKFVKGIGETYQKISLFVRGSLLAMKNFGMKMTENIKKALEFTSTLGGISFLLNQIKTGANIFFRVTGVTAAMAGIRDIWSAFSGGGWGGGTAFGVIGDFLATALEPLNIALYELALEIGPLLVDLFLPFTRLVANTVKSIAAAIKEAVIGGGEFSKIFQMVRGIIVEVADLAQEVIDLIFTEVVPQLLPVFHTIAEELAKVVKNLIPVLAGMARTLLPLIGKVVRALAPVLQQLIRGLGDVVEVILTELSGAIIPMMNDLSRFIPKLVPMIQSMIEGIIVLVRGLTPLIGFFAKLTTIIVGKLLAPVVLKGLELIIQALATVSRIVGESLIIAFKTWGQTALDVVSVIVDGIASAVVSITGFLVKAFTKAFELISAGWDYLKHTVGWDKIDLSAASIFNSISGLYESFIAQTKKLVNGIIDVLNKIAFYDLPVIGKLGDLVGLEPIKKFAEGGVVKGPTKALIGEGKHPELVLPLTPESIEKVSPALMSKGVETKHGRALLAEARAGNNLLAMILEELREMKSRSTGDTSTRGREIAFTIRGFA